MISDKGRYRKIRRLILINMIFIPVIPFALALVVGSIAATRSLGNLTTNTQRRMVEDHALQIDTFLKERQADLEFITSTHSYTELTKPNALHKVFERLTGLSEAIIDLGVFDPNGLHVAYEGPHSLIGKSYNETEWFQAVRAKGTYISNVFLGYRNIPHFIIAVTALDDTFPWVLRATIDTRYFNYLVKNVRMGNTGEAFIVDRSGRFQTERRSGGGILERDPDSYLYPEISNKIQTFVMKSNSGNRYLYAASTLKSGDWILMVRQETQDAFHHLRIAGLFIAAISIAGGIVIILAALYGTDRVVRRLRQTDQEKSNLENQLVRAGRLAELGEMAAGFAHEINNPLQVINSEQALIRMLIGELKEKTTLDESDTFKEIDDAIDQIHTQVRRSAEITSAILKFGRLDNPRMASIDLESFIPDIIQMIQSKVDVHGVRLEYAIPPNLPSLTFDPGQLQQILLNLLNNAIDSVINRHGAAGGMIRIAATLEPAGDIRLSVTDNGMGIPAHIQDKVFTPFFTTKPVGKGTGLGLSVCYGIVTRMGGSLALESDGANGATITLRLPTEDGRNPVKESPSKTKELCHA